MSSESEDNGDVPYDGVYSSLPSSDDETAAIATAFEPYEGEPLALGQDHNENLLVNEDDPDGLFLVTLEERFECLSCVNNWCQCNFCNDSKVVGAREFHCCK